MAKRSSNEQLRLRLWPEVSEETLWMSNKRNGYSQVPRGLSLINRILDATSQGKPLSSTYLAIWCNLFDNAIVRIDNPVAAAFESGFSGPRAVTTWKSRIKLLIEIGFIQAKAGATGEYNYLLLVDPYKRIIELNNQGKLENLQGEFNALMEKHDKANPPTAEFTLPPPYPMNVISTTPATMPTVAPLPNSSDN